MNVLRSYCTRCQSVLGAQNMRELLGRFENNSAKKESIERDCYWFKTRKDAMFETSRFLRRFCNL